MSRSLGDHHYIDYSLCHTFLSLYVRREARYASTIEIALHFGLLMVTLNSSQTLYAVVSTLLTPTTPSPICCSLLSREGRLVLSIRNASKGASLPRSRILGQIIYLAWNTQVEVIRKRLPTIECHRFSMTREEHATLSSTISPSDLT